MVQESYAKLVPVVLAVQLGSKVFRKDALMASNPCCLPYNLLRTSTRFRAFSRRFSQNSLHFLAASGHKLLMRLADLTLSTKFHAST